MLALTAYGGRLMLGTVVASEAKREAATSARDGVASTIFSFGFTSAVADTFSPGSGMAEIRIGAGPETESFSVTADAATAAGCACSTAGAGAAASLSFKTSLLPEGTMSKDCADAMSTTTRVTGGFS